MSLNQRWKMPGTLLVVVAILVVTPGAWSQTKYQTLHRFQERYGRSKDGLGPVAGLTFDRAGNLYGTTESGGAHSNGTVFELTPNSSGGWTESVLYSFCSLTKCQDGEQIFTGVIFDQAGNLYGTTTHGGIHDWGTVFQLSPNSNGGWTEKVLYNFCSLSKCSDGSQPESGLIFDQAGNLYGTTASGGEGSGNDEGTVFELEPNANGSWTESVLHSFNGPDGLNPQASLILDAAGNLYGTTEYGGTGGGGTAGGGTIFELMPASGGWTESVLYDFCSAENCADGLEPAASLIFDQTGNLYGTTVEGGAACNCGVVFQLTLGQGGSWMEKVLHAFTGGDGSYPSGSLVFDSTGNLFGTAHEGGNLTACPTGGCGVVFKLVPESKGAWHEAVLHDFMAHPGALPAAGMIFDSAGNLYGTTNGYNSPFNGSVFEITP
jgi:uncharacterized repeat protein (TIGR03803 family)